VPQEFEKRPKPLVMKAKRSEDDALRSTQLNILEGALNDQQLAAVTTDEPCALVLAGAGSGKTRVITYRVAYLLSQGVKPGNILLATFTNKAARMMLRRVEDLTNVPQKRIVGGTFHHIGHIFLRKYADLLGYSRDFTIIDEQDARQLMKVVRKEAPVDFTQKLFPSARLLLKMHSLSINTGQSLDELMVYRFPQFARFIDEIGRVITAYIERKLKRNLIDFDDLLTCFLRVLTEHPDAAHAISGRFQHVLVDEYQDTNLVQAQTIRALSAVHGRVFVVGDDAQSIYAFRGASFENIRNFTDDYPDAKIFKLETNYRSTPQILQLANEIMREVPEEFRKLLRAVRPPAEQPSILVCHDAEEQAQFVAEQVLSLREEGIPLPEIGVLYRNHRNSLELELTLSRAGIPYEIRGGLRFIEQAHVKDVVAFLSMLANPRDEVAFSRVLDMCEQVGSKTIALIFEKVMPAAEPLKGFINDGAPALARGAGRKSLETLAELFRKLDAMQEKSAAPADLIRQVVEDFYDAHLLRTYENYAERREDLEQLAIYSQKYRSLRSFLAEVALNQGFTVAEAFAEDAAEEGRVSLSTIHQAKGLEWSAVFVAHLTDGNLPHRMCLNDPAQLEEERRLFYVAVTRAQRHLYLSYPQNTDTGDYLAFNRPSRFLQELPRTAYEHFVVEFSEDDVASDD
jgi:DNA helicase-2/ATP-dependent DNA helicase PcrA